MTKSFPVKYMVVAAENSSECSIIDTSYEGQGEIIADCGYVMAHRICKLLNESEGYRYDIG